MRDELDLTPLDIALDSLEPGCVDVAYYLTVNRECGGKEHKKKLICRACYWGKLNIVKKLVTQHGVDPKCK